MANQENQNEGKKGLFPWWLAIGVGVALGAGMGTATGQMNVCVFVGWGLGALAALVFGRRS
jgi:amino acid transporter